MIKLLHWLIAVFLLTNTSFSQGIDTLWTRTYFPCEYWDNIQDIVECPWRGVMVAGQTTCVVAGNQVRCGYIQRIDQSINPIWTHFFGEEKIRIVAKVLVTDDQRVAFVGSGRNGRGRVYGVLNPDGDPLWISPINSYPEYNLGLDICHAVDNGFVVASMSEQEPDTGKIMVEHISESGEVVWRRFLTFSENDQMRGIEPIGDSYVVLCNSSQSGESVLFAEVLSQDGTTIGRLAIDSSFSSRPEDIVVIGDSLIAAMGSFLAAPDAEELSVITMFDLQGNVRWRWSEHLGMAMECQDICPTPSGGLILCGSIPSPVTLCFVLELMPTGALGWYTETGTEQSSTFNSVVSFGEGTCIAAGQHQVIDECNSIDDWIVGIGVISDVMPRPIGVVRELSLSTYPNPFNSTISITLDVPLHQEVKLALYDLLGREVDVIHRGRLNSSAISYTTPASLSSGVYFLRAASNELTAMQKVVLLK